jgi:hypothetical protein
MTCQQCQTNHTYSTSCHDCGVRLIMSAYPAAQLARAMTDYVKSFYKADPQLIIKEAREKWKLRNGQQ